MPTPEQVRSTVEAYADAVSRKDRKSWLDLFTDDAVQIDPVGSPPNRGRDAIGAFWDSGGLAGADSVSFEVGAVHVCGNEAAYVFTLTARFVGSGIVFDGVEVITVAEDGRIAELRAYWNPADIRSL
ncbi:MAG: nuclear transport factor 2 family protein [Acidimicrobiales bacterium]